MSDRFATTLKNGFHEFLYTIIKETCTHNRIVLQLITSFLPRQRPNFIISRMFTMAQLGKRFEETDSSGVGG